MAKHANNSNAPATRIAQSEIVYEMPPFLRTYKDGRVERLVPDTFVPASEDPGATGVATRDVAVDRATGVSARLFLSVGAVATGRRLPLVVYFHGGAFCTGSAFSDPHHSYAASLSARAGALVVSIEYRLAPEHPIPAAYEDAWVALRWAAARSDPWLAYHADPTRTFLVGDSAGANIAHSVAARVADDGEDGISIEGMVLLQPFFWGTERLPSETDRHDGPVFSPEVGDTVWPFVTAGAAGNNDPRLNPPSSQVASLPCGRAFVAVARKDLLRDRGCRYAAWLRRGDDGSCREVTLVESKGRDHGFHLYRPKCAAAVALMDRVAEFINGHGRAPSSLIAGAETEPLHAREGTDKSCRPAVCDGPDKVVRDCLARNDSYAAVVECPRGRGVSSTAGRITVAKNRL
jgi:acetyl esterase/lipase